LDGTDNFETRFLLNDFALKRKIPWVFGACLGSEGQTMTILPGQTPCLRCLLEEPPAAGTTETCESAGILSSASAIIAAIEVTEAMKIVTRNWSSVNRQLTVIDVWSGSFRKLAVAGLRERSTCPACDRGQFEWLDGKRGNHTTRLCGRNAVQIVPAEKRSMDWAKLQDRIALMTPVDANRFLMRFSLEGYEFSVFPDGRAIIKGTDDIPTARTLYARYLGG
jgi:adenylyltransferase/sulfurtransferase